MAECRSGYQLAWSSKAILDRNWVEIKLVRSGPSSIGEGDDELVFLVPLSLSLSALLQQRSNNSSSNGESMKENERREINLPLFVLRPCSACTGGDKRRTDNQQRLAAQEEERRRRLGKKKESIFVQKNLVEFSTNGN